MTDSFAKEISKLKYHVNLLSQMVDREAHPVSAMVVSLNLDEDEFYDLLNVFNEYRDKLKSGETFSHIEFEHSSGFGYQRLKTIIRAFVKDNSYVDVCFAYIKSAGAPNFVVVEYQEIAASERFKEWLEQNP